jgi:hypothetical protein
MIRILEKFQALHLTSGPMNKVGLYRDILHYYGHDYSLPLVFGISGLLGFTFHSGKISAKEGNTDQPTDLFPDYHLPDGFVAGEYFLGLNNALRATNVWCQRGTKNNKHDFFELLKTYINEGRPVHIEVNRTRWIDKIGLKKYVRAEWALYLNWVHNTVSLANLESGDYHIICIGYNDENFTLSFLDYYSSDSLEIHIDDLFDCTDFDNICLAPANKWYVYYVPLELPDIRSTVSASLKFMANSMINPFKTGSMVETGLRGLDSFVATIHDLFTDREVADIPRITSQILINSYSQNSLYDFNRMLFSEFLEESSTILNEPELENIAYRYAELARDWDRLIRPLKLKAFNQKECLSEAEINQINTIKNKEHDYVYSLWDIISTI